MRPQLLRALALLVGAAALAPAGFAQQPSIAVLEGDPVLTAGTVRFISKLLVTDAGVHFVEVTLADAPSTSVDTAILRNGFATMIESDPILAAGGVLQRWTDISANSDGHLGWALDLQETPGMNTDDTGMFWNAFMLAQEGSLVQAPQVGLGTVWKKFLAVKINDKNQILGLTTMDDPALSGSTEGAFVLWDVDDQGTVLSENVLLRVGDPIPGTNENVKVTSAQPQSIALANTGSWIGQIASTAPGSSDTMVIVDGIPVAIEGDPSPVPGRVFDDLRDPEVGINDFGSWAFNGALDRTNTSNRGIIIRDGELFARQGDTFPAISPATIDRFNAAPIRIGNSGDIFWHVETSASSGSAIYMRNKEILVQAGVTKVVGATINKILTTGYAFDVSRSGRFWVGEVVVQGRGEAMILFDFGLLEPIPGCQPKPASLTKSAGDPIVGNSITFELDATPNLGALPIVFFSSQAAIPGNPCGVNTKFGEVLIGLGPKLLGQQTGLSYTGSPSQITVIVPPDPSLAEFELWVQGAFLDSRATPGSRVLLSDGLRLVIGAP